MKTKINKRGFSIVEVIMGVSILSIVLAMGFGMWQGFRVNTELDSAARNIVDILRQAQNKSATGQDFLTWGVYFESSGDPFLQMYSGTDYASGTKYDYIALPASVQYSTPAAGASANDTVEIEVTQNSDVTVSDSSTITGAPAAISGTTTLN